MIDNNMHIEQLDNERRAEEQEMAGPPPEYITIPREMYNRMEDTLNSIAHNDQMRRDMIREAANASVVANAPTPPPRVDPPAPEEPALSPEFVKMLNDVLTRHTAQKMPEPTPVPPASLIPDELEARFKKLESLINVGGQKGLTMNELCMFPDAPAPPKMKYPEVTKFNGTGNPISHLKLYVNSMGHLQGNQQWLIKYFMTSLTGPALSWFTSQNFEEITTFEILARRFVEHFGFITEIVPTRTDLEALFQKKGETFSAYLARWKEISHQLKTPVTLEEGISMVI